MLSEGSPSPGRIVVGLAEGVSPDHAPVPQAPSEALLFRQLYETLVLVDCAGQVRPGLAARWSRDGAEWTFVLREGARFSDGTPVTVGDVLASFTKSPEAAAFRNLAAVSAIELRVRVPDAGDDVAFFARASLAVAKRGAPGPWPLGTGAFRVAASDGDSVVCESVVPGGSTLVFRNLAGDLLLKGRDVRDAFSEGVDALVVHDRAVAEHAAAQTAYTVYPLPWTRTYVLVSPWFKPVDEDTSVIRVAWPEAAYQDSLARDAVSARARGAALPFAWMDGATCEPAVRTGLGGLLSIPLTPAVHGNDIHSLSYPSQDEEARRLAERLVALFPEKPDASGASLPYAAFGARAERPVPMEWDQRFSYRMIGGLWVLPLARDAKTGCSGNRELEQALATMLRETTHSGAPDKAPRGFHLVVPLIDTGNVWVARRGLAGVRVDGDGVVRLENAGWTRPAP